MRCACGSVFELCGNKAKQYAREHLTQLSVDQVQWTVRYRCPNTGRQWLKDYPRAELHGGGPCRLRQLDAAGEPVDEPGHDPFH